MIADIPANAITHNELSNPNIPHFGILHGSFRKCCESEKHHGSGSDPPAIRNTNHGVN